MSMGNSGLFHGTTGARADEANAPIGFDETPPEPQETDAHTFFCYDHVPRTIVPPLTNGGCIRSMDNHELADWLAELISCVVKRKSVSDWGQTEFFNWLSEPVNENGNRW